MKRLLVILAALLAPAVWAAEPAATFGASVTGANGSLSTTLTWTTAPVATGCMASGHPSWTGAKPASGTQALPAITMSGTYTLTLTCSWPADTGASLSWTAPSQNTDGSALAKCASQASTGACLRSFRVHHGTSAGALTDIRPMDDRNSTGYAFSDLPAGTHYFAVSALNGDGVESALSVVGNKVIGGGQTRDVTVTLTVNPIPNAPSGLTVQ